MFCVINTLLIFDSSRYLLQNGECLASFISFNEAHRIFDLNKSTETIIYLPKIIFLMPSYFFSNVSNILSLLPSATADLMHKCVWYSMLWTVHAARRPQLRHAADTEGSNILLRSVYLRAHHSVDPVVSRKDDARCKMSVVQENNGMHWFVLFRNNKTHSFKPPIYHFGSLVSAAATLADTLQQHLKALRLFQQRQLEASAVNISPTPHRVLCSFECALPPLVWL